MHRHVLSSFAVLALLACLGAAAQQTDSVTPSGMTLSTSTQLVVVDVVVEDRDHHPVHNLKASDFQVQESRKPQVLKAFEEHIPQSANKDQVPALPALPPGTFTDYTPVAPDSTLNVLLIDRLNTPMKDQSYVRNQLQQYVKHLQPGARIAIFGLTNRLIFLQGFTSDPETLKEIVEHRLIPRGSALLDDPSGSNADPNRMSDALTEVRAPASVVAAMKQFEAQTDTFQTALRTRYTLDAFNQLARYLGTFSGRKNVIWFSGSFPLTIFPDPGLTDPFAAATDASGPLRETTNLLDRARVSVYPIDARGLQTMPMFDPSRSGAEYVRDPGRMAADIGNFNQTNSQEHMTMARIAEDTGGQAFYNTNGLADAVAKSIEAGSHFYTLTYSPADHTGKGEYRRIDVKMAGNAASRDLRLSYRRGYFAPGPNRSKVASAAGATPPAVAPPKPAEPLSTTSAAAAPASGSVAYARASMQLGAPTPSEIVFKVRVLPASRSTEPEVAAHNVVNPAAMGLAPFRRYDVDFAALTSGLGLTLEPDGRRTGGVEFLAYVYDPQGKLLNIEGDTLAMNLAPETYRSLLKSGMRFHLQVSAPATGESFLRLAIHDTGSGRMGVVEVSTATVARLAPSASAASTPASATSPAPATNSPSSPNR